MRSRLSLTVAALLLAGACSDGGGGTTLPEPTSPPTIAAATTTSLADRQLPPDIFSGWQRVTLPATPDFTGVPLGVEVVGTGLLAFGIDADDRAAVWSSADGVEWERLPDSPAFAGAAMAAVVEAGPGLVAVGSTASARNFSGSTDEAVVWTSSDDGETWERQTADSFAGAGMVDVAAFGSGLVAVGSDGSGTVVWTSDDGATWERVEDPGGVLAGAKPNDLHGGGERLVMVGVDASFDGVIWTSGDGARWTRIPEAGGIFSGAPVWGVTERGGRLVAVGQTLGGGGAAVWVSDEGALWERVALDSNFLGATMLGVAAGDDGLAAFGLSAADSTVVWSSGGGTTWAQVPADPEAFGGFGFVRALVFGGPGIVAVGDEVAGMTAWVWRG